MKFINSIAILAIILSACDQKKTANKKEEVTITKPVIEKKKPNSLTYSFTSGKAWKAAHKNDSSDVARIVLAINRTDKANIGKDSILIPSDSTAAVQYYLPFPDEVPYLKEVKKILLFSYATQAFGAYENGKLVYAGQTNMGRKADPTPTGLYFTNWKAEKTTSTFNDEWDLKWNFNIENKEGIGFHEYALPGYPASHSCLRLIEADAKYLYTWADQWILKGANDITANGTPVIVFGSYNFGGPKPWLQLVKDPHALDISAAMVEKEATPFLDKILAEQKKRDDAVASGAK
jgi:lipoprotein-anchoring transpeptidase ErfK/SrfK